MDYGGFSISDKKEADKNWYWFKILIQTLNFRRGVNVSFYLIFPWHLDDYQRILGFVECQVQDFVWVF